MPVSEAAFVDLLRSPSDHPDDEQLHHDVGRRMTDPAYDEEFSRAIRDVFGENEGQAETLTVKPKPPVTPPTWSNCIGEQTCSPSNMRSPMCLEDLLAAVEEGKSNHLHVRAVGSGHSFSDVAPTDGILLDPHGMNRVLEVQTSSLRNPTLSSTLFSVESRITIKDLNNELDKRKLALINMGAYDGQTPAGAISTGTHGTGITLGPIASSVRSLVLVSESGTVYQIEPSNGITDPAKFAPGRLEVVLKQDDAWFQSTLVAMGCMGLIYSYTLEVMPAYLLSETRAATTWEAVKRQQLADDNLMAFLKAHRQFEVDINPYALNDQHMCVMVVRDKVNDEKPHGHRSFADWLSGLLARWPLAENALVELLNRWPTLSPCIITRALETLVNGLYVDKSFNVMNIGPVDDVKAFAIELSLDVNAGLVDAIDKILDILAQAAHETTEGRPTCMVEFCMLLGINNGKELLKHVKEKMCTNGSVVRVHWGLDLDSVTEQDVKDMFPKYEKWMEVYGELNSTGMFDSAFTERLGISMGRSEGE